MHTVNDRRSLRHIETIKMDLSTAYDSIANVDVANETGHTAAEIGPRTSQETAAVEGRKMSAYELVYADTCSGVQVQPHAVSDRLSSKEQIDVEVREYLKENPKCIPQTHKPVKWWKENHMKYPRLSLLSKKYLSCPPSSVESERLFSVASHIFSQERNRLERPTSDKLMFINFSLRQNNFQC